MSDKTFFGFKEIDKNKKEAMVKGVFSSVAPKYDIMNDLMSFGIHRLWKDRMIKELNPKKDGRLLDVAGGTGDIAFRFLKSADKGSVTVCDINNEMLLQGQKNAIDRNILKNIEWVCGNAEKLPFKDDSYDYYTIAFGIRNVTNIDKALKEAFRILKPGGKFVCLEFSNVNNAVFSKIYNFFSFNVIPQIGKIVMDDKDSYQYLVESIKKFPKQENFKKMIEEAGFDKVKYTNMTDGVVAIHTGWKI